jgi:hypothetical protein
MLRVRRVRRYKVARYPAGSYTPARPHVEGWKRGGATLLLLALLEACDDVGTTGPPPVMPDWVTENEARGIVERVFADSGIALQRDVPLVLRFGPDDSTTVTLDGFNDSLRVGYEYLAGDEYWTFGPLIRSALVDSTNGDGPYVDVFGPEYKFDAYQQDIERHIEAFLDTLRAHGVI